MTALLALNRALPDPPVKDFVKRKIAPHRAIFIQVSTFLEQEAHVQVLCTATKPAMNAGEIRLRLIRCSQIAR
jgi:hypothetical protein